MILGGIIESNFVRTMTIVKAQGTNIFVHVLTRPLCIGILLLTVYLIWANVRALQKGRAVQKNTDIKQDLRDE